MSISSKIGAGLLLVGFLCMGWALIAESPFKTEIDYTYVSEVDREPTLTIENLSTDHDPQALEETIDMKAQRDVQGYIPEPKFHPGYGIVPKSLSRSGCDMPGLGGSIYVKKDAAVHHVKYEEAAPCHVVHKGRFAYNWRVSAGSLALVLGLISIGIGRTINRVKNKKT
jgi:hypothetical protein